MKTAKVLACCLLILPLAGPAFRFGPTSRARSRESGEEGSSQRLLLTAELRAATDVFRAGHYNAAADRYRALAARGTLIHDTTFAARATANFGGCLFALHRYQPALQAFLDARTLAERARDSSTLAGIDTNIASLYTETNDLDAAARWIEGTRERLTNPQDRRAHLPELLLQLATIRARQRQFPEALALFRQGTADAARAGDLNLYAIGWNRLGEELLLQHNLPGAEPPLIEAYRVRKLYHLPLYTSYRSLGRLRLEQGDLRSASLLLDRAVELASGPRGQIPTWDLYASRGRARLAQGRLREALDDLRTAVRLGRAWRWSAVPDDGGRIGEEGWLEHVVAAFIEAGNRLYLRTEDPALLRETFEVLEENRASSLRLLHAARSGVLPADYWEDMAALQTAEVRALRSGKAEDQEAAASARAAVARLEASLARQPESGAGTLLGRAQQALSSDAALFSFHLGDQVSWLWAVDRQGIELRVLPSRAALTRQVEDAAAALHENLPAAPEEGAALYRALFGGLTGRLRFKQRWLLTLDGSLYDAPLAALAAATGNRPTYLVELHTLQVIPGVGWWLEACRHGTPLTPLFVGIGDPVYNTADSRLASRTPKAMLRPAVFSRLPGPGITLPRLVGSGSELAACARAWDGDSRLLTGAAASTRNLQDQLQRNPSVLHFATHVLETEDGPSNAAIALSLNAGGEAALLRPSTIAQWHIRTGLVVLSGCHSAAGEVLPGTGLLGLTRAWLAAGADGVIGSQWATTDDSGALFSAFYRKLRRAGVPSPAQALRAAQLEMLHSGDWHADPRYWGAYFAMGIEGIQ